jgi:WD40 repeat protein
MFFTDGDLLAGDKIWDVNTGQPINQSLGIPYGSVFSLDGNTMFFPYKGDVTVLNMETGEGRLFARFSDQSGLRILAVNPDGDLLAVLGMYSGNMMLAKKYDLFQPLGRLLTAIADPYKFTDRLVFSPDGQTLIAASPPAWGVTMQWDVQSGRLLKNDSPNPDFLPNSKKEVYSLDGNIKASIDFENDTIVIWDAKLDKKIRTLDLEGDQLWKSLALSPDGKMLAAKDFLELVLWDVESGQNIGEPLKLTGEEMVFSPNGKLMATTGVGYVVLWDMDPQSWLEQTCKRVGRNLTGLEWQKYFPGEQYRLTCPQWPAGE